MVHGLLATLTIGKRTSLGLQHKELDLSGRDLSETMMTTIHLIIMQVDSHAANLYHEKVNRVQCDCSV